MKQLILGGTRSGKSSLAERLATEADLSVIYIATATAGDTEMEQRIQQHRANRPQHWSVIEEPIYLADAIDKPSDDNCIILIDCLTLWLTNLLLHEDNSLFLTERDALLDRLSTTSKEIIMVSNEVGMGIVPLGEISRRFQDESGWLHQSVASLCDRVILTVAGIPQVIKGNKI